MTPERARRRARDIIQGSGWEVSGFARGPQLPDGKRGKGYLFVFVCFIASGLISMDEMARLEARR